MILDTDAQTVMFRAGEILTLDQVWSIIYILEPELDQPVEFTPKYWCEVNLEETGRYIVEPQRIFNVRSDSDWNTSYAVVAFTDYSWACSCPDWQHRRQFTGEYCKHMNAVRALVDL